LLVLPFFMPAHNCISAPLVNVKSCRATSSPSMKNAASA
jgi:hypothetical protein